MSGIRQREIEQDGGGGLRRGGEGEETEEWGAEERESK